MAMPAAPFAGIFVRRISLVSLAANRRITFRDFSQNELGNLFGF
jgi:hypothetical protein